MKSESSEMRNNDPSRSQTAIPKDSLESAAPSCHKCNVGRGYRPFLDYVELCPFHGAASRLFAELQNIATAFHLSGHGKNDEPTWVMDECRNVLCVQARNAIALASTQPTKSSEASHNPELSQDSPASESESSSAPATDVSTVAREIANKVSMITTSAIGAEAEDEWFDKCVTIITPYLSVVPVRDPIQQALKIARNNLCVPYRDGDCKECDGRMQVIDLIEKAARDRYSVAPDERTELELAKRGLCIISGYNHRIGVNPECAGCQAWQRVGIGVAPDNSLAEAKAWVTQFSNRWRLDTMAEKELAAFVCAAPDNFRETVVRRLQNLAKEKSDFWKEGIENVKQRQVEHALLSALADEFSNCSPTA